MSALRDMGPALKGGAVAALAAILGLVAWAVLAPPRQGPEHAAESAAETALPEPSGAVADEEPARTAEAVTPPEPGPEQAEPAGMPLPTFDIVRVEADGSAVIGGRAAPRDRIALLLDGEQMAETEAGGDGAFVAVTRIEPAETPRVLTLLARGEAGERRSEESVIVAPVARAPAAGTEMAAGEGGTAGEAAGAETGAETAVAVAIVTEEAPRGGSAPDAGTMPAGGAEAPGPSAASGDAMARQPAPMALARPGQMADAAPDTTPDTAADTTPGGAAPERVAAAQDDPAAVAVAEAAPEAAPEAEPEQPQLLMASREGLRVLQPAGGAEQAAPLRVETIGYAQGGVRLAGRAAGGPADLRIYLDNAPVATAPLGDDGAWQADLEGVEPGTYTLRVDQIGADGKVTSRFETPFLRESEEALARNLPATSTAAERIPVSVITVQPGYSLWAIASDRYGDGMQYHKVLAANRDLIRDPDLIYPGQVFDLPE